MTTMLPLFNNKKEFSDAFNKKVIKLTYSLKNLKKEEQTITLKLDEDITLIENIDDKGDIHELIMLGQEEGTDIVLTRGMLIDMTNSNLNQKEVGQVLKDLGLFDENYKY